MASKPTNVSFQDLDLQKLSAKELQKWCEVKHLPKNGRKEELVKHLEKCKVTEKEGGEDGAGSRRQGRIPDTPESLEPAERDAVVVASRVIGDDEEMIMGARDALGAVLEQDEIYVDCDVVPLAVGNTRGLGLASLPHRIDILKATVASHGKTLADNSSRINSLEHRVEHFTLSDESYKLLRHRFIVNYKKAKLGQIADSDKKYIQDGDRVGHGGDAKADSELYRDMKARDDFHVFKRLYGFYPQFLWSISMQSIIY